MPIPHTPPTVNYASASDLAPARLEIFRQVVTDPETGEQSTEIMIQLYATRLDTGELVRAGSERLADLDGRLKGQATAIEQLVGRCLERAVERLTGQTLP